MKKGMTISDRKNNHIDVCLNADVRSRATNGFEKYKLIHNALPEADFDSFSTETTFLGKTVSAPIMISSMTGGTEYGERINRNLISAAAELNLPFAIGSQRIYLADPERKPFPVREIAPGIPVLANVGAVQMNYGFTEDLYRKAVEMIRADALILHLNPLQEILQQDGNRNFSGLLKKIETLCRKFPVPVIVKEVGYGIRPELAARLIDAGVAMIDVAGAGGTSWSRVESLIEGTPMAEALAAPFSDWGIPTAENIRSIRSRYPEIRMIASGGIMNGVDAAKAILLGAELAGMAGRLLPAAAGDDPEAVIGELKCVIKQYKIARFLSSGIEKCV